MVVAVVSVTDVVDSVVTECEVINGNHLNINSERDSISDLNHLNECKPDVVECGVTVVSVTDVVDSGVMVVTDVVDSEVS